MSKIKLIITTTLNIVFQEEVDQITLTTTSGEITILPKHTPLISTLKIGQVIIKNNNEKKIFTINGGLLDIRPDGSVIILSTRSENVDDLDLARAEEAMKKAQEIMQEKGESAENYKQLQSLFLKEQNRIKLARQGHRR